MAVKNKSNTARTAVRVKQSSLPIGPAADEHLDISALETWLWDAACAIRGATDAPKFKDFILPLVFYKRLSDVFEDEFADYVAQYGDEQVTREVIEADHADALQSGRRPIVRFYIPPQYSWLKIRNQGADGKLEEFVTTAMRQVARLNPDLQGVLDVKDYNERQSGQRSQAPRLYGQELNPVTFAMANELGSIKYNSGSAPFHPLHPLSYRARVGEV